MRENAQLRAANDKVKLEAMREVNDKLDEERPKLREQANELANQEYRRREAEQAEQNQNLRIQLAQSKTEKDALARTVEELQRQLERGTPAIIGAAQHVELGAQLRAAFPQDYFRSIKPGARGGDILQTFRSEAGQTFGRLLLESKRVQHWSNDWIEKAITDKDRERADDVMIVSDILPRGVENFGRIRGVCVVKFSHAIPLIGEMRRSLFLHFQELMAAGTSDETKFAIANFVKSRAFWEPIFRRIEIYDRARAMLVKLVDNITNKCATLDELLASAARYEVQSYGRLEKIVPGLPPLEKEGIVPELPPPAPRELSRTEPELRDEIPF
jgi:hypothetical protein